VECTLAALLACFSWSGLYIDGGLQYHDSGVERSETITRPLSIHVPYVDLETEQVSYRQWNDRRNPYGALAVGYEIEFRSVSMRLEFSHASSLATGDDRGLNSASFMLRWRPFAR
jgi:hypothetical protein